MAEEESELDKPLMFFGRDIRKVPCFRESFLYGISSGIGAGLLVFLYTSKPRYGSHAGVASLITVTMTWFCICRVRWAEQKFTMGQIKGSYQKMIVTKDQETSAIIKDVEVADA